MSERARLLGLQAVGFKRRRELPDYLELSRFNDDRTREIMLDHRKAFAGETHKGKEVKAARCYSLYNVDMPNWAHAPVLRNTVMRVEEREYVDGTIGYTIDLDTLIPEGHHGGFSIYELSKTVYEDDGRKIPCNSYSYPLCRKGTERAIFEGIKPDADYPEQIDINATAQKFIQQMEAGDFSTPQLVPAQSQAAL